MPKDLVRPTLDQRLAARQRPAGKPVMRQSWRHLLFLHWRIESETVQRLLPPGLTIDTYDGAAWVGIVPFFMCDVRPVWSPSIPGISHFLELNVRTYVFDKHGTPGVWFFSLDASSHFAVMIARRFFNLPYFYANMRARATPASTDYWSQRSGYEPDHFVWQPAAAEREAVPGSLDFFLVERYFLFSQSGEQLFRGQVHHPAYQLHDAKLIAYSNHLLAPNGLTIADPPEHTSCVWNIDVDIFGLEKLA